MELITELKKGYDKLKRVYFTNSAMGEHIYLLVLFQVPLYPDTVMLKQYAS